MLEHAAMRLTVAAAAVTASALRLICAVCPGRLSVSCSQAPLSVIAPAPRTGPGPGPVILLKPIVKSDIYH
jgi:hypothetical protein